MKFNNKLVRDRIPEIIKSAGKQCEYRISDNREKLDLLISKLDEETQEFKEDKNLEELADLMEVLFALTKNLGFTEEELIKKREEKRGERGGFDRGIVLQNVYE